VALRRPARSSPSSVARATMSDECVDAVAQLIISDEAASASMPLPVAQLAFLALPADARRRACCVCRAWRDALADPSLWSRLDMSVVCLAQQRNMLQRFLSVLHARAVGFISWTCRRCSTSRGSRCCQC